MARYAAWSAPLSAARQWQGAPSQKALASAGRRRAWPAAGFVNAIQVLPHFAFREYTTGYVRVQGKLPCMCTHLLVPNLSTDSAPSRTEMTYRLSGALDLRVDMVLQMVHASHDTGHAVRT
jgi:hypothetical protein